VFQGLLPSRRHIEKREDPGDEVELKTFVKKKARKNELDMCRLIESLFLSFFFVLFQLKDTCHVELKEGNELFSF